MNIILSLIIIAGLILVHETGHMLAGIMQGIPRKRMSIQLMDKNHKKGFFRSLLFSISPHVALLDSDDNLVSPFPNEIEKYVEILENFIPEENRMYWFVAGGHALEFTTVLSIAAISLISNNNVFQEISFRITHLSLTLTVVYMFIDLFTVYKSKQLTGGDFSGQWAISPIKTICFYLLYFTGLVSAWVILLRR
ncbi:hypothetical protein CHISP_1467 [Chitinispirillum alkaliphilum]|nr:hypothetical protein CHISP_1467 [Chitinispirillum alkaliphilum]